MSYFGHNTVFYLIFQNECSSLCEMGIPVSEGLCILLWFPYTITLWTLSRNVCSISLSILQWAMAGFPQEMKKLHVVVTLAASAIFSLRKNLRTQPVIIRQEVHFERITTREPPVLTPSLPAIKRNEIGSFVETWMDLETVIFSEVREKNKYHISTHICGIWKNWHKWSYLQSGSRDTDIENKCTDTKGERVGWWDELRDWDWHRHTTDTV